MAWIITQFGEAVNLDHLTHIWAEDGSNLDGDGIATARPHPAPPNPPPVGQGNTPGRVGDRDTVGWR